MLRAERVFGANPFAGDLAFAGDLSFAGDLCFFHSASAALLFTLPIGLNEGNSAVAFRLGLDIPPTYLSEISLK